MPPIRNLALLVGVEHSLDGMLRSHEYIAADLRAMKKVLGRLGYARSDLHVLCGKDATRQAVVNEIEAILASGEADQTSLLLFFAAPGFAVAGSNFLFDFIIIYN